jgi:hypothetical protein
METLAWVTAVMQSAGEVILNAISIEDGDIAANLVNIFGGTLNGIWKLAEKTGAVVARRADLQDAAPLPRRSRASRPRRQGGKPGCG